MGPNLGELYLLTVQQITNKQINKQTGVWSVETSYNLNEELEHAESIQTLSGLSLQAPGSFSHSSWQILSDSRHVLKTRRKMQRTNCQDSRCVIVNGALSHNGKTMFFTHWQRMFYFEN